MNLEKEPVNPTLKRTVSDMPVTDEPNSSNETNDNHLDDSENPQDSSKTKFTCPDLHACTWLRIKSIVLTLASASFIAVMLLCVKLVPSVPPFLLGSVRMLVQVVISGVCLLVIRPNIKAELKNRATICKLIARCFIGSSTFMAVYFAACNAHLGDAAAISFSSPVLVAIFGCICLKEKSGPMDVLILTATIVGAVMVAHPSFIFGAAYAVTSKEALGLAAAFGGCLGTAIVTILLRSLRNVHVMILVFFFSVWATLQTLIASAIFETMVLPSNTKEWIFMFLSGLTGTGAQLCVTVALQLEKAALISVLKTTQVLFVFFLEWAVLGYVPVVWSAVGASLIMLSVAGASIKKLLFSKEKPEAEEEADESAAMEATGIPVQEQIELTPGLEKTETAFFQVRPC